MALGGTRIYVKHCIQNSNELGNHFRTFIGLCLASNTFVLLSTLSRTRYIDDIFNLVGSTVDDGVDAAGGPGEHVGDQVQHAVPRRRHRVHNYTENIHPSKGKGNSIEQISESFPPVARSSLGPNLLLQLLF